MMNTVVFISTALPEIRIGSPLEMHFPELLELFRQNLSPAQLKCVKSLRLLIDLKNLKEYLRDGPLDLRGNYNKKEMEDALLNEKNFPGYFFDFLDSYEGPKEQIEHFARLYAEFFANESTGQSGFLQEYFAFERELRLLLTAYRSRKTGMDLVDTLKYEDVHDPFVSYLLASKDVPNLEMPLEYADLSNILSQTEGSPKKQYQALIEYRLKKIAELSQDDPFTLGHLLSYMQRLILVEDWYALDDGKGNQIINQIVKVSA